ncbi:MAG: hypothetical protein ABJE66_30930 [Deltaproteobacteria bacterium]
MLRQYVLLVVLGSACSGGGTSSAIDAAPDVITTDGRYNADDGTPTRLQCTSQFGNKLSSIATYGRLDGYLVAIVAPTKQNGCNADSSHVHLQIRMMGAVYDVAVDATDAQTSVDDVHTDQLDHDLGGPGWAEGWHTDVLNDYVAMGLHSSDLVLHTKPEVVSQITTFLATANHISVYMTSYGPDGGHLVHRNGNGHDGIIVTDPLSQPSHFMVLSFSDQAF